MNSSGFVEYILDILSPYGNIKSRRMFGGYGLYVEKIIFALIIEDEIYFKADIDLAENYKVLGSYPFTYKRDEKSIALSYWYVPSEVLEDNELLKSWFNQSLTVARKAKITKVNKKDDIC
ncbi:MAG: TfoX/Sxy family protein [Rickettsiales bacterium]